MIIGLLWLLGSLLVGEVLVRIFDAPVPGSIVGMVLLFVAPRWQRASDDSSVIRVGHFCSTTCSCSSFPPESASLSTSLQSATMHSQLQQDCSSRGCWVWLPSPL